MSTLREVLRLMKRGQRGPLTCPVCGARVKRTRTPLEGWILPVKYYCEACKYTGFVALERDLDEEVIESDDQ